jgi:hypothetical protein
MLDPTMSRGNIRVRIRAAVQSVPTYEADHFAEGSAGDRDDERARHTVERMMALG